LLEEQQQLLHQRTPTRGSPIKNQVECALYSLHIYSLQLSAIGLIVL
jgi:hypothetical protein